MAKKNPNKPAYSGANFNDVLIRLINAVYNLINSGNIVGVLLLYFCVQVFYITQKLSPADLDKRIGQLFAYDYFYVLPLGGALFISVLANFHQRKVYKRHIEELVETRRELIHGLQTGELRRLKRHTSSGIDSLECEDDC